jgi:hypothetical protein
MLKSISAACAICVAVSAQAWAGAFPSAVYPAFSASKKPIAASVPAISGKYLLTYIETCQATVSTTKDPSTGDVGSLNTVEPGQITHDTGLATVSSHSLTTAGFEDKGSLLIVKGISGQTPMAESSWNQNVTFSNTASTVTIGGGQFHAWFSPASGAAQSIIFSGLSSKGCAATGTMIKQ